MARHLTGDTITQDGVKYYLLWPKGVRNFEDGTQAWEAENELGESRIIWIK